VSNKFQDGCVEENINTESLVRRMLSTDYADKVIVTTIQKLGIALDPANRKNYKERLESLSDQRMVFIFDECHRSQFGENHEAIKDFFPKAQLFGFTGTPIFEQNASYFQVEGKERTLRTTDDIFGKLLHAYTITEAIEDQNVLRFHIDYYKPDSEINAADSIARQAIVEAILKKHDAATHERRFNALLATSSIDDAMHYYNLFKQTQSRRLLEDENFKPLNIACVFSPPAEGDKDVQQLQEELPQEKADNAIEPDAKKKALDIIIADYNEKYGTNHNISLFDFYYKDVQQRIKDQKYSNEDYPHTNKIDITIVVDMLLTGFDSKYLNTLYVDKKLKWHGLIQAFSRTNRVLNGTKPYGNILDFRFQEDALNEAITLFSGNAEKPPKEIWLVDPAPMVIEKFEKAVSALGEFMNAQGLDCLPDEVNSLKGDEARSAFINCFKEIQRLKTQLDQYTDLNEEQKASIELLLPEDQLEAFRGSYLDIAKRLKAEQDYYDEHTLPEVQQLDFEFVLFASALIDYDYIIALISKFTQYKPTKQKMTREQLVSLLSANANFFDERDDLIEYIYSLRADEGLSEKEVRDGYQTFKAEKLAKELAKIAGVHGLETGPLQIFVENIMSRMIFDGEKLSELFDPLDLGWKERTKRELALMEDLTPLLKKQAAGREISGLKAYE